MKHCSKCGLEKDDSSFCIDRRHKTGLSAWCRQCKRENDKSYYSRVGRDKVLTARYGISEEGYRHLQQKQNGKCAICGVEECPTRGTFIVDHNHATNEVRGLLCLKCNTSLGGFRDSPDLLMNAYQYLIDRGYYGQHAAGSP